MDTENNINYRLLIDSISYYESKGFKYKNVDWIVNKNITGITKPIDRKDFFIDDKCLVASAEQSFLHEILNNNLSKGKYCALSPCFRDEEKIDELHRNYFMKVELIQTDITTQQELLNIIHICLHFYNSYMKCEIIETEDGYDIVDSKNRIELGSYGIRKTIAGKYIYATGLAEPRFSIVLNKQ